MYFFRKLRKHFTEEKASSIVLILVSTLACVHLFIDASFLGYQKNDYSSDELPFIPFRSRNLHVAIVLAGLNFRTGSQGDIHVDKSTEMQAAIGKQWQEIRSRGLFGKTDMYIRTKANQHTNQLRAMFDTPNVSIVSTPSVDDYD